MQSQRHIRDHIFETVADAQNSGRTWEICFVKETQTGYEFLDNSTLTVNGKTVLSTVQGGNTRWKAIWGKYEIGKFAVPTVSFAQYTVFVEQELPELVFDANGDLVMHLATFEDI